VVPARACWMFLGALVLPAGRLCTAGRVLRRWLEAPRAGRGRLAGCYRAAGARIQASAERVRPCRSRVRRLTAAVRRLSQAWFLAVPR